MYSRSFYPTEAALPPENYGGIAFSEGQTEEVLQPECADTAETAAEACESCSAPSGEESQGSLFSLSGITSLFKGGIFSGSGFLSDLKTEDILIIAVAAFLLFSKDGDIETAILLILLLFVK